MTDDLDRMLQGGAKSATFANVGDTITGIVVDVIIRQATEYGTGAPQTFDNGDPREQIVVTIKAEGITPEDGDDDLHRSVYIKGWGHQRRAFIDAVKKAAKPTPGDRFTATYTASKPSDRGGFPAKVFEYRIEPMQAAADEQWATSASAGDATAQAKALLNMGTFTAEQVAAATGLSVVAVQAMSSDYSGDVPF